MKAKLVKESLNKYEVVYYEYDDEEVILNQKFNSEFDANNFAYANKYDFEDIAIDEEGNDYWKTFYRYFNPEDKQSYFGYDVREIST